MYKFLIHLETNVYLSVHLRFIGENRKGEIMHGVDKPSIISVGLRWSKIEDKFMRDFFFCYHK